MKKIAQQILSEYGGKIPDTERDLLKLKGVGHYTANAVLAFAYGKCVPVVDSNIARVLRRYFNLENKKPAYADRDLWALAKKVLPLTNCREYNYGLLDLAALICHPKNPECEKCPLREYCSYEKSLKK